MRSFGAAEAESEMMMLAMSVLMVFFVVSLSVG